MCCCVNIFFLFLQEIPERTTILEKIYHMCSVYHKQESLFCRCSCRALRNCENLLREHCSSFYRMDYNTQFSEIFTEGAFQFSVLKRRYFLSKYAGICKSCQYTEPKDIVIFINYLSLHMLSENGFSGEFWPAFFSTQNATVMKSQCPKCPSSILLVDCFQNLMPNIFLVECPDTASQLCFRKIINIADTFIISRVW